jgi:hypothetical protein
VSPNGADLFLVRMTIGKGLLLVLAAAASGLGLAKHENRIHEQDTLARIASELAGHKVGVRCPGFFERLADTRAEAGSVEFDADGRPADHADLSPETCKELRKLPHVDFTCLEDRSCGYAQFQAGWAAHTLAHESFHLRGFGDEGVTECYAVQNTSFVAQRLGIPKRRADELQRWLFAEGYPNEPPDYHAAGCYAGGPLDLRPADRAWP